MSFELFVARRYLLARRKQALVSVVTLIAIAGVAVGTAALVIALALMSGFSSDIRNRILGTEAHVFLAGDVVLGGIEDYRGLMQRLEQLPHVAAVAANVFDEGIMEGPLGSERVILRGVVPADEARVTDLEDYMKLGSLDGLDAELEGRPTVVLGQQLALELGARLGDSVRYQSFGGPTLTPLGPVPRRRTFKVAGVFETQMHDYDRSWALVSLGEAQRLLRLGDAVNTIKLRVADIDRIPEVTAGARELVRGRYLVRDLLSLNKPLLGALKLEKLLMFIAIGLIVAVAALNIVTTLTMMVMEKNRDIGILIAMGATARQVLHTFMLQGLIIGITGTVLGLLGGVSLALALDHWQLIPLEPSVYFIPYLPFQVVPHEVVVVGLTAVAISFVATVWPALRAARLDPVEALRHE